MNFKVAASDFDGTLFRDKKISVEDAAAIRAWRAAGNKFGIVTGRPILMLTPCLENFGVEVDFTVCDNGAIIYGDDGRIIFESELPKKILRAIVDEPAVAKTLHFLFEAADEMFCVNLNENSWVITERAQLNFPLKIIDAAQIDALPKINQLALGFITPEAAKAAVEVLNKKFGDTIDAQRNFNSVDIVATGINKAQGVENLLQLTDWRGAKIFFIGDESNDLPAIKKFGGCTVVTAKDFVKREAAAVFDSVGAMLNSIRD